jgi:hypothetical protein
MKKKALVVKKKQKESVVAVFNDEQLKLGTDYTIDAHKHIVLSDEIKNKIANSDNFNLAYCYTCYTKE